MKFLCVAIRLKMKELFYNKVYIAVLGLLPLIVGLIGIYGSVCATQARLRAGIYLEEETILSRNLRDVLLQDDSIQFIEFETSEAIEKAVATSEIECGFIIQPSIDEAVSKIGQEASIVALVSPATVASGPMQETVCAAFFRLAADEIAIEVLQEKAYMSGVEDLEKIVEEQVERYYQSEKLMEVELITSNDGGETLGENQSRGEKMGIIAFGKGVIGVCIFVASLLLGAKGAKERKTAFYNRFKTTGKSMLLVDYTSITASCIYQILSGALGLIILYGLMKGIVLRKIVSELIGLTIYIISMNSLIFMLTKLIKEEQIWLGITPVLSIASVIFCPVIIDFGSIQSILKYGSYFFLPSYYLYGRYDVLIGVILVSSSVWLKSLVGHVDILSNREVGMR